MEAFFKVREHLFPHLRAAGQLHQHWKGSGPSFVVPSPDWVWLMRLTDAEPLQQHNDNQQIKRTRRLFITAFSSSKLIMKVMTHSAGSEESSCNPNAPVWPSLSQWD